MAGRPLTLLFTVVVAALVLLVPIALVRAATPENQQQKLTVSDAFSGDFFGSVAIDGDTAVVGASRDDDGGSNSGSAYVFTRSGTTWTQQQKLTASDPGTSGIFDFSVAIDGDTVVVGANGLGSAYVFTRSGTTWTQQQNLKGSDTASGDNFGFSVGISGDTVVVGAIIDAPSGSAYVFTRSGTTWTQQQKLTASDTTSGEQFGRSIAVKGNTTVVGAPFSSTGSAYVFTRSGTTWTEQQKLTASDAASGDQFGRSTAVDGDTAFVGDPHDDDSGSTSGSVYVFTRSGTTWTQQQKLTASAAAGGDQFGISFAVDGDTAIVGAHEDDDGGEGSGSAYVFTRSGTTWTQQLKLQGSDTAEDDEFGEFVGVSGDTALVGTRRDDDAGSSSGSAYVSVPAVADLSIAKSANPTSVNAGSNVAYTITVTNNGPDTATSLTVADTLPTNATFVSSGSGCGSPSAGVVTCTAASLANGANVQFTITVTAPNGGGTISNTASVTSNASDPNASDDSVTLITTVNPLADLSVTKTDSPDPVQQSQSLTYQLNPNPPMEGVGTAEGGG